MVTLLKSETVKNKPYGLASTGDYTAYSFLKDCKEHFICNLVTAVNDPYHKDKYQRSQVAERIKQLRKNDFRYLAFHARVNCPIAFLQWVHQEGYTLQIHGELFVTSKGGGFIDFHGNLVEYSASFHFRIYDKELLKQVGKICKTLPKKYHYRKGKNQKVV